MLGLGMDLASISKTASLVKELGESYLERIYAPEEIREYHERGKNAEYLAGRFAVKEAFFKATSQAEWAWQLEPYQICTLGSQNGAPRLVIDEAVGRVMEELGAQQIFVSISGEGDLASAIVVIE